MKHRLLFGVCIIFLFSVSSCGSENGLSSMEPVQEQKTGENVLQTNKESEMPAENDNPSQIVYSATIEKQIYLPEEENLSTNVQDAEEQYVFLGSLSYRDETCDGLPEYSILFNDGSQYYVNITDGWIWRGNNEEVKLTDDEKALIKSFIQ